jgi:hypothetical protein
MKLRGHFLIFRNSYREVFKIPLYKLISVEKNIETRYDTKIIFTLNNHEQIPVRMNSGATIEDKMIEIGEIVEKYWLENSESENSALKNELESLQIQLDKVMELL